MYQNVWSLSDKIYFVNCQKRLHALHLKETYSKRFIGPDFILKESIISYAAVGKINKFFIQFKVNLSLLIEITSTGH